MSETEHPAPDAATAPDNATAPDTGAEPEDARAEARLLLKLFIKAREDYSQAASLVEKIRHSVVAEGQKDYEKLTEKKAALIAQAAVLSTELRQNYQDVFLLATDAGISAAELAELGSAPVSATEKSVPAEPIAPGSRFAVLEVDADGGYTAEDIKLVREAIAAASEAIAALGREITGHQQEKARREQEARDRAAAVAKEEARLRSAESLKKLREKIGSKGDIVFVVADARNPYRAALLAAGVPTTSPEAAERKDVTVNLSEEIRRQADYFNTPDETGHPVLPEWAEDITSRPDLLLAEISTDETREKIIKRLEAGMIPIVMPGLTVQERTWQKALAKLKPRWIKDGVPESINDGYIYEKYASEKMNRDGFFKDIPDRPYLVWTKPTAGTETATRNKTFTEQIAYNDDLVRQHLDLYDTKDMIPTEYVALQACFTRSALERYTGAAHGKNAKPKAITPLDDVNNSWTRFLSAGAFSDRDVPDAFFSPDYQQVHVGDGNAGARGGGGFRPVARS